MPRIRPLMPPVRPAMSDKKRASNLLLWSCSKGHPDSFCRRFAAVAVGVARPSPLPRRSRRAMFYPSPSADGASIDTLHPRFAPFRLRIILKLTSSHGRPRPLVVPRPFPQQTVEIKALLKNVEKKIVNEMEEIKAKVRRPKCGGPPRR